MLTHQCVSIRGEIAPYMNWVSVERRKERRGPGAGASLLLYALLSLRRRRRAEPQRRWGLHPPRHCSSQPRRRRRSPSPGSGACWAAQGERGGTSPRAGGEGAAGRGGDSVNREACASPERNSSRCRQIAARTELRRAPRGPAASGRQPGAGLLRSAAPGSRRRLFLGLCPPPAQSHGPRHPDVFTCWIFLCAPGPASHRVVRVQFLPTDQNRVSGSPSVNATYFYAFKTEWSS